MPLVERLFARLIVMLSVLLALFVPTNTVAQGQSRSLEIISFGDSITAGLRRDGGVISCPSGVSLEPARFSENGTGCYGNGAANVGGYQGLLKASLDLDGYQTTVYNWGFSGVETAEMINQLNGVINAQPESRFVLILGGANDAFKVFSKSTVRHNIEVMADIVLGRGMIPVLGTPTPITVSASLNKRINGYNDEIRALANQRNFLIADHNGIMAAGWEAVPYHSGDQLHLSSAGNQQLAINWFETLGLEPIMAPVLTPIYLLLLKDEE